MWSSAAIYVFFNVAGLWIPYLSVYFSFVLFGLYGLLYGFDNFLAAPHLRRARSEWIGFLIVMGGLMAREFLVTWSVTLPTLPILYRIL